MYLTTNTPIPYYITKVNGNIRKTDLSYNSLLSKKHEKLNAIEYKSKDHLLVTEYTLNDGTKIKESYNRYKKEIEYKNTQKDCFKDNAMGIDLNGANVTECYNKITPYYQIKYQTEQGDVFIIENYNDYTIQRFKKKGDDYEIRYLVDRKDKNNIKYFRQVFNCSDQTFNSIELIQDTKGSLKPKKININGFEFYKKEEFRAKPPLYGIRQDVKINHTLYAVSPVLFNAEVETNISIVKPYLDNMVKELNPVLLDGGLQECTLGSDNFVDIKVNKLDFDDDNSSVFDDDNSSVSVFSELIGNVIRTHYRKFRDECDNKKNIIHEGLSNYLDYTLTIDNSMPVFNVNHSKKVDKIILDAQQQIQKALRQENINLNIVNPEQNYNRNQNKEYQPKTSIKIKITTEDKLVDIKKKADIIVAKFIEDWQKKHNNKYVADLMSLVSNINIMISDIMPLEYKNQVIKSLADHILQKLLSKQKNLTVGNLKKMGISVNQVNNQIEIECHDDDFEEFKNIYNEELQKISINDLKYSYNEICNSDTILSFNHNDKAIKIDDIEEEVIIQKTGNINGKKDNTQHIGKKDNLLVDSSFPSFSPYSSSVSDDDIKNITMINGIFEDKTEKYYNNIDDLLKSLGTLTDPDHRCAYRQTFFIGKNKSKNKSSYAVHVIYYDGHFHLFIFDSLGQMYTPKEKNKKICTTITYMPSQQIQYDISIENTQYKIDALSSPETIEYSKRLLDYAIKTDYRYNQGYLPPELLRLTEDHNAFIKHILYYKDDTEAMEKIKNDIIDGIEGGVFNVKIEGKKNRFIKKNTVLAYWFEFMGCIVKNPDNYSCYLDNILIPRLTTGRNNDNNIKPMVCHEQNRILFRNRYDNKKKPNKASFSLQGKHLKYKDNIPSKKTDKSSSHEGFDDINTNAPQYNITPLSFH